MKIRIEEYFGQIYKDPTVYAEAEEQVVYPAVRPFYDDQAEMKVAMRYVPRILQPMTLRLKLPS